MAGRLGILAALVAAVAGCHGPSPGVAFEPDARRRARLAAVVSTLLPEGGIEVGLSPSPELGAWSWPDGRVRVSRPLVDRLDDALLAAALAHEIGHLLDQGHLGGVPLGVRGGAGGADVERRADRIACHLLALRGLPRDLGRLLELLAAESSSGAQELISRRDAADAACGRLTSP